MSSVLIHTGDEGVTLTGQAVKRLLERGNGDAALLYLALLRRHGGVPPRSLAGELRWDRARIEGAEGVLRELGLIAPAAADLPLVGAALRQDTADVRAAALDRGVFLIGSEGRGLSREALERCAATVRIPMTDRCESLNAAAAAAVVLWEGYRQL